MLFKSTDTVDLSRKTPTVRHKLDIAPVQPSLIPGLTAHHDLLGFVEGHLAANLADLSRFIVADIGLDA